MLFLGDRNFFNTIQHSQSNNLCEVITYLFICKMAGHGRADTVADKKSFKIFKIAYRISTDKVPSHTFPIIIASPS